MLSKSVQRLKMSGNKHTYNRLTNSHTIHFLIVLDCENTVKYVSMQLNNSVINKQLLHSLTHPLSKC